MSANYRKRVIDIDPFAVADETLAALRAEAHAQSEADLNEIKLTDTVVIDSNESGGLDSHITVFTDPESDGGGRHE